MCMLNIMWFLLFIFFFILLALLWESRTLLELFFFMELLWIVIFVFLCLASAIFDDLGLHSMTLLILMTTAVEAGLTFVVYKFFPYFHTRLTHKQS